MAYTQEDHNGWYIGHSGVGKVEVLFPLYQDWILIVHRVIQIIAPTNEKEPKDASGMRKPGMIPMHIQFSWPLSPSRQGTWQGNRDNPHLPGSQED